MQRLEHNPVVADSTPGNGKEGSLSGFPPTAFWRFHDNWMLSRMIYLCLISRWRSRFPEVRGKIETRRAQLDFLQQNRRSRKRKTGVWSANLGFTPHFWNRPRKYAANSGTHEHTALFVQRNRRYRRCGIPVCSACLEFAAYFRFSPLRQATSTYILG